MELPFGMTKIPTGWTSFPHAFLSFLHFAVSDKNTLDWYQKDTGEDLRDLANRSSIDQLIDQNTGYGEDMFKKLSEWLVVNIWGEE